MVYQQKESVYRRKTVLDQEYFDNFDSIFPFNNKNYMDPFLLPMNLFSLTEADAVAACRLLYLKRFKSTARLYLENGMTVKDYYNHLYYGKFFSIQDMQQILDSEMVNDDNVYQVSKRLEFVFKEANSNYLSFKRRRE